MFDIAPTEFLAVAVVALLVIGPKDLPKAMRVVGHWVGRARGVARQFRSGFDSMVREAELADMEKKWAEENKRIMDEHPAGASQAEDDGTGGNTAVGGTETVSDHAAATHAADVESAFAGHEPDLFSQPVIVEKPEIVAGPDDVAPAADTKANS